MRGVDVPRGPQTEQHLSQESEGIRWRGSIGVDHRDVELAAAVVDAESASVLVAVPAIVLPELEDLVAQGWSSSNKGPPAEVLLWLRAREGLMLWTVGGFDDPESGVVVLGATSIVEKLRPESPSKSG